MFIHLNRVMFITLVCMPCMMVSNSANCLGSNAPSKIWRLRCWLRWTTVSQHVKSQNALVSCTHSSCHNICSLCTFFIMR